MSIEMFLKHLHNYSAAWRDKSYVGKCWTHNSLWLESGNDMKIRTFDISLKETQLPQPDQHFSFGARLLCRFLFPKKSPVSLGFLSLCKIIFEEIDYKRKSGTMHITIYLCSIKSWKKPCEVQFCALTSTLVFDCWEESFESIGIAAFSSMSSSDASVELFPASNAAFFFSSSPDDKVYRPQQVDIATIRLAILISSKPSRRESLAHLKSLGLYISLHTYMMQCQTNSFIIW